ncbi:MAG: hypothetical protein LPK38_04105, partial [Actinomycetes bacterium]|nr:hypothetical protein [Actinomycetes bacterium]MDX5380474.1 hypothetical protein [Actinomycetes bacterium]MDX5399312.1 hypothetical protein [Actinomycetes bacterium]MDX5450209.1 hypothetical protein [Actinomycetes bacterium]
MPAVPDATATFLRPWEEVTGELEVDPERGLSDEEARIRLERDGPNELRSAPPVPL